MGNSSHRIRAVRSQGGIRRYSWWNRHGQNGKRNHGIRPCGDRCDEVRNLHR